MGFCATCGVVVLRLGVMTEDHEMRLMKGPSLATKDANINICFGGEEIQCPKQLTSSVSIWPTSSAKSPILDM